MRVFGALKSMLRFKLSIAWELKVPQRQSCACAEKHAALYEVLQKRKLGNSQEIVMALESMLQFLLLTETEVNAKGYLA